MGADDDINAAVGQSVFDFPRLFRRHQPGNLLDVDGIALKPFQKRLKVLATQQRRRHHHQHLTAVERGGESGPQRDLGLAEADIAAHQPVHGPLGG